MNVLEIKNVKKSFNDSQLHVLKDISLTVAQGEVVAIIGPSGSGKSTLLRCATLLTEMDSGDLLYSGDYAAKTNEQGVSVYADKQQLKKIRSRFGLVFQNFNLFPHFSVLKNLTDAPIQVLGRSKEEAEKKAMALLEKMGLADKADAYPCQLSGGQQQRVAIARALVNRPKVLLLDEPLGALDLRLRKDMQNELKRIQQQMGIPFIYVTHDQEEALTMSDTVVVMDKGRIQQIGTPEDIYNEPKNAFVADFIGESNILDGVMHEDYVVEFFNRKFKCLDKGFAPMEPVDVVIRPEDIEIVPADKGRLVGTVTSVTFKGVHYDTIVDFKGYKWLIQTTDYHEVGEVIGIILNPDDIHIMKKSEYSGQFGDYSSYSAEYDEINDPDFAEEDEEDADDED